MFPVISPLQPGHFTGPFSCLSRAHFDMSCPFRTGCAWACIRPGRQNMPSQPELQGSAYPRKRGFSRQMPRSPGYQPAPQGGQNAHDQRNPDAAFCKLYLDFVHFFPLGFNSSPQRAVETQGEEMNKIKVELAKSSVRIALIVGVLSALGGGLVSWAARHLP